jgi:electron transport complex protein RnfC
LTRVFPQLIIPVRQHAGPAGELLVRVGDKVKKGNPHPF